MNQGLQRRWTAQLSQDFDVVFESTRRDSFLCARVEGGIEQRSKCFRQITRTHYRRTDTPPASLEHLEPQCAVLDARREEQSRRRPLKVVQQGKGSSVWQRVLAEYEVKLRRADQMACVPIRAGELAAAATSSQPFQQVRRASRGLADEKYHYWFRMHIFCLSGEARRHQQLRGSVCSKREHCGSRARGPRSWEGKLRSQMLHARPPAGIPASRLSVRQQPMGSWCETCAPGSRHPRKYHRPGVHYREQREPHVRRARSGFRPPYKQTGVQPRIARGFPRAFDSLHHRN